MRNLVQYPLTLGEIESYLQRQMAELQNQDPMNMPIGNLDLVILDTLLEWTKEKQSR